MLMRNGSSVMAALKPARMRRRGVAVNHGPILHRIDAPKKRKANQPMEVALRQPQLYLFHSDDPRHSYRRTPQRLDVYSNVPKPRRVHNLSISAQTNICKIIQ
jgi:hypothetical protein